MHAVPAILAGCATLLCESAPVADEDPLALSKAVISQQIDAFLKDDADTAYSFAAPGIKARFADKSAFFAMVKKSYGAIYRPGNYAFSRSKLVGDGSIVVHELTISGQDGKNWKAFYKLSRQSDGHFKIDGVVILPDTVSRDI